MTKAFVHGNPETAAIWGPLVAALERRGVGDIVTLSPPGFGAPVPDGFRATPAGYVEWLADAIRPLPAPVDLVGHDWGAGHAMGLVAAHPELVRSWAVDIVGLLHPDYVWHDMAQVWQTPGDGEAAIDAMVALGIDERTQAYLGLGLPEDIARDLAAAMTADMGRCILELYRGGAQPALRQLADRLAEVRRPPGLALDAAEDAYVSSSYATPVAERFGMEVLHLAGQHHWWMVQDPEPAADGLVAFWDRL